MKSISVILFAYAFLPLAAQTPGAPSVSGSIDGAPIPDRVFNVTRQRLVSSFVRRHQAEPSTAADEREMEVDRTKMVCNALRGAITRASRDEQKKMIGISASANEIETERSRMNKPDPAATWKEMHDRTAALATALSEVYDHGKNPRMFMNNWRSRPESLPLSGLNTSMSERPRTGDRS